MGVEKTNTSYIALSGLRLDTRFYIIGFYPMRLYDIPLGFKKLKG